MVAGGTGDSRTLQGGKSDPALRPEAGYEARQQHGSRAGRRSTSLHEQQHPASTSHAVLPEEQGCHPTFHPHDPSPVVKHVDRSVLGAKCQH